MTERNSFPLQASSPPAAATELPLLFTAR